MQHNTRMIAVLCVLCCALLLTIPLGLGQTQGRYDNTVSWKGVYSSGEPVLSSNILAEGGQTVLLEEWNTSLSSYRKVDIRFVTDGDAITGSLQCQVDSDLVTAKVDQSIFSVGRVENLVTLTLTATEMAAELAEETVVTIRVNWIPGGAESVEPTIWADFSVKLLPAVNQETQVPTTEAQTEQEDQTEPAETVGTDQQNAGSLEMIYSDAFAKDEALVLKLTLPEGTDSLGLSYDGSGFPQNTRYTVDSELSCVLADEMTVTIPVSSSEEVLVQLDFSWTAITNQSSFFISAVAYADGEELAATNVTVSSTRQALSIDPDTTSILLKADTQAELPVYGDLDGFTWTLEHLIQTNEGVLYTESDDLAVAVETVTDDADSAQTVLVISNENGLAPAGTYRLTLQRVFDGVVLSSFEIPVFIYY